MLKKQMPFLRCFGGLRYISVLHTIIKVAANFYNKLEYAKLLLIICTGNTSHYKESDLIVHYRRLFPVQCHLIQRPQEVHPANTQVKKNLQ